MSKYCSACVNLKICMHLFICLLTTVLGTGSSYNVYHPSEARPTYINPSHLQTVKYSYGETCNETISCSTKSFLTCVNNKCQCFKQQSMSFDKSMGKCVFLAGERCRFSSHDEVNEDGVRHEWFESSQCISNATCNPDGYCECSNMHKESSIGQCVPKGLGGEPCNKSRDCREDMNLVCRLGICKCIQDEAVFDPSVRECVALVGKSCARYRNCVRYAYCDRYAYSRTSSGVCTCGINAKYSKNGRCLVGYDQQCDHNVAPCIDNFSCVNGRCKCPFPEHQFYDTDTNQCLSYVHGPCATDKKNSSKSEKSIRCIQNAECGSEHGIQQCVCKNGYIESKDRSCDIAFGQACNAGLTNTKCDRVADLKCKDGTCQCLDLQIFDTKLEKCRGLAGSRCSMNNTEFCMDNSECVGYRDNSEGKGICLCTSEYVTNSKIRRCVSPNDDSIISDSNQTTETDSGTSNTEEPSNSLE